jgi:hypothetical protein
MVGVIHAAAGAEFYVSDAGNDAWSGKVAVPSANDGPFLTLERARDAVRALKQSGELKEAVTINISGSLFRDKPFELGAEDSGTADARITYRTAPGAAATLTGGKGVAGFKKLEDAAVLDRMDPSTRGKVYAADLKAQGITDYGTMKRRGFGLGGQTAALEVFYRGDRMQLARWPNDEWARIHGVPAGKDGGKFGYDGDRPEQWKDAKDMWAHGYWTWDWAESYERIDHIDTAAKEIFTVAPHGVYGYRDSARYYVLNLLEELDAPGEWYLDREKGLLYLWPAADQLNDGDVIVSLLETPMWVMKGVSCVTVEGIGMMYGRNCAMTITGGAHNLVRACTVAHMGTSAISASGGTDTGVRGCEAYDLGEGGIAISGGDRKTLAAGGNYASNNHIHHYGRIVRTYTAALSVGGVGNRLDHNLIHDAPHMAIGLDGNDHAVEYNEVHHVCMETHDCGAFYMGRDWTQRGNVVRYNFMHELGHGDVQAIYLDDWTSGVLVYGNVCEGALRGVLAGGGRDNVIENNIFVNCKYGVHIDQRGLGWAKYYFDGTTNTLFDRMKDVNGDQPPYADKYPKLKTLLKDEPALAKNNKVVRNINAGGEFLSLHDGLKQDTPYLMIKDNFTEGDPGFVDAAKLNFRLKEDSPAFKLGFKPIPMDEIGPRKEPESSIR